MVFLFIFRNSIEEWIFSDFVELLRNMDIKVGWLEAPTPYADWIIGGVLVILFLILVVLAGIDTKIKYQRGMVAWQVYDNLSNAFKNLMYATGEADRVDAHACIEKERGKLPDKELDKLVRLLLDAESERIVLGMNPSSDAAQRVLSLTNERIRNHFKSKYGGRDYGKPCKL